MGTPHAEEPLDFTPDMGHASTVEQRPSELVSEAIRRDLLTLACLPGLEAVGSTYRQELLNGLDPA